MNQRTLFTFMVGMTIVFNACTSQNAATIKTTLSTAEFSEALKSQTEATVLDVRTPGEFADGHLQNALNIDWNGNAFELGISKFNKTKPVFVYCLSGGRSSAAAQHMRSIGFEKVYEMDGGMMGWRSAKLPETQSNVNSSPGMSLEAFTKLINSHKTVLIDFYADWCAPCKKMKPWLDEIALEKTNEVKVIRINADENPAICQQLKIDGLPVVQVYFNGQIKSSQKGLMSKAELLNAIQ